MPWSTAISLRVGDALHRVDAHAMRGSDHPHARAILLAQISEDRAFDVGIETRTHMFLNYRPLADLGMPNPIAAPGVPRLIVICSQAKIA